MKKQSGFTLIELLLVLAIIGIISAIAIPAILSQRDNARDKTGVANATSIISSIYSEIEDQGISPANAAGLATAVLGTSAATAPIAALWTTVNPHNPGAFDPTANSAGSGYNHTFVAVTSKDGEQVINAATVMGQVQIGYAPEVDNDGKMVIAAGVLCKKSQPNGLGTANKVVRRLLN